MTSNHFKAKILADIGITDFFESDTSHPVEIDLQGWQSQHPFLTDFLEGDCEKIIIEVGVWKGASTIHMANHCKNSHSNSVIISVDTFLGSSEHYNNSRYQSNFGNNLGEINLLKQFVSNVKVLNLEKFIVPLPLDSLNASELIIRSLLVVDIIHIDGGHNYDSVILDLMAWWPILKVGGVMIMDDYSENWPGVTKAVDEFLETIAYSNFQSMNGKCCFIKSNLHTNGFKGVTNIHKTSASLNDSKMRKILLELDKSNRALDQLINSKSFRFTKLLRLVKAYFSI